MVFDPLSTILQLMFLLITPPFFVGVINRVKSIFAGRKGQPVLQLYFDIFKLFRKGAVYSSSGSLMLRYSPVIILVSVVLAGITLPMVGDAPLNFSGDVLLFVYLFALVRFLMISSAMDVGSSFEGMGASREAIYGAFAELTVFTLIITLVVSTHSLSLNSIFSAGAIPMFSSPYMILLFLSFFFIVLVENSRMPVDDPNTHLELTMVHEVMILDHSGPDLGLMLYAASMKLFIFMTFAVFLMFPNASENMWVNAGLLFLKVAAISISIGVIESVTARIRLIKIPQFLIASFVLAFFALILAFFGKGML